MHNIIHVGRNLGHQRPKAVIVSTLCDEQSPYRPGCNECFPGGWIFLEKKNCIRNMFDQNCKTENENSFGVPSMLLFVPNIILILIA